MIRVGIIGCGRVSDQHIIEIRKIQECEIVGVCDKEELMAKQLAERFGIKRFFNNPEEMLAYTRPNVIHITTPPQSHFELGKLFLNAGCNVLFEKPMSLNFREVQELIQIAEDRDLKITVGHNMQFTWVARRLRDLIRSGYLGGPPVHMESIWCYSYNDPGYTKAILGDKNHWVRKLPGKILHNIISHGISKITEYLKTDSPEVLATAFTSRYLIDKGEVDILDELRVIIYDENSTTAYFTFSTLINPIIHQFRVYGPKRSIIVDDLHQTIIEVSKNYKSYLNHFIPPLIEAKGYLDNGLRNIKRFLKRDLYMEEGRKYLFKAFYQSIEKGIPVPIPYREILLTSKIMDKIFEQIKPQKRLGNVDEFKV